MYFLQESQHMSISKCPETFIVVFRRAKNLKDFPVRAKIPQIKKGWCSPCIGNLQTYCTY